MIRGVAVHVLMFQIILCPIGLQVHVILVPMVNVEFGAIHHYLTFQIFILFSLLQLQTFRVAIGDKVINDVIIVRNVGCVGYHENVIQISGKTDVWLHRFW